MLDPRLKDKITQAYATIGDIGFQAAVNLSKGKDHTTKQEHLWTKGRKIRFLVKVLNLHIDLDTTPPTLYRITEEQVNRMVLCLEKLANLEHYPIYPSIQYQKPIIKSVGLDGQNGQNGLPGKDANIIVEAAPGEDKLQFELVVDGDGVKHYRGSIVNAVAALLTMEAVGGQVYQIGQVLTNLVINLITTKGNEDITALTVVDSTYNALLQPNVDLDNLNGVTQPVTTFFIIPSLKVNKTIEGVLTSGVVANHKTLNIVFYYPFLSGSSDSVLTTTHYTALGKNVTGKSNFYLYFNNTDKYFYVGYPSSYGECANIKDQNGFDVTSAFTTSLVNVTSSGLDENWTVEYRFYRSTFKTDINGTYVLNF